MSKIRDLTGRRFGRLVVEQYVGNRRVGAQSKRFYRCRCDCGSTSEVASGALSTGSTSSCGCREGKYLHGESHSPVFKVWHAMIERCRNPRDQSFKDYGGRGIKVCARWMVYAAFRDDMGPRPAGGTLERMDVNGDYEHSNCRWASQLEQANNRRNNRRLTFNGETYTVAEWARRTAQAKSRLIHRLKAGWPLSRALTQGDSRGRRRTVLQK